MFQEEKNHPKYDLYFVGPMIALHHNLACGLPMKQPDQNMLPTNGWKLIHLYLIVTYIYYWWFMIYFPICFISIIKYNNSCRFFLSYLHLRFVKECNLSNYLHRTMLFPQLQWRIIAMDLFFRVLLQKWLRQLQQQILLQVYCMLKEYGKTTSYLTSAHHIISYKKMSIVRNLHKPEPSDMNGHCLMLHIQESSYQDSPFHTTNCNNHGETNSWVTKSWQESHQKAKTNK